ncbi:MAG TPA: pilus assembly protein [Candidatus Brocadiia bacterium]|nr:pilus assembly protein [Candidatus Brocadiia bacterium]
MRNATKRQKGQVIVECAFILPVVILLGIGTLEYANLFTHGHILTVAARHGARIASMHADETAARAAVINFLAPDSTTGHVFHYPFTGADCTITFEAFDAATDPASIVTGGSGGAVADAEHGDFIRCTISYPVPLLLKGMMPGTSGEEMIMTGRAIFMCN